MAVHTWVSIVLIGLLVSAVVAFCAGWAAHAEYRHRYHTGRQSAREWASAETPRGGQPLGAPMVLHVHLPPAITPLWVQPVSNSYPRPVIEGDVSGQE